MHTVRTKGAGPVGPAPPVPIRTVVGRFWPYARPHRGLIVASLVLAAGSSLVSALTIGMFKVLVDRVLVPRDLEAFWWVALAYVGLTLLAGVVGFGRRIASALAAERFVLDLRQGVFDRVQTLSLGFFERRHLGDVIARMTGDVKAIERLVVSGILRLVLNGLRIIVFAGALFWLQWQLALASLVAVPLFAGLARRFSVRIRRATREQTRHSGALSAVVEESLANVALVQAYNQQGAESERLAEQNHARYRARMEATRLRATYAPLVDLTELLGTLVVAGLGTWLLIRGELTLGGLLAFAAYLSQLYGPVGSLGNLVNTAYAAGAGAERVIELLDAEPEVRDRPGARAVGRTCGHVALDHVEFVYPGTTRAVLRDLSLDLEPGTLTALVGSSGAGKSSVVKLALRFHDPQSGAVRLDGEDLRDLTVASVRDNVAVVLQETLVFDGTLEENIRFGNPAAGEEDVERAIEAADLREVVEGLPEGMMTRIGQRGRLLSGGQRQRLSVARAMVRDAPVLVLDEPTAGLDPASAARLVGPIRRLLRGRTALVVSHDPEVIAHADRVVRIEGGRVVEDLADLPGEVAFVGAAEART